MLLSVFTCITILRCFQNGLRVFAKASLKRPCTYMSYSHTHAHSQTYTHTHKHAHTLHIHVHTFRTHTYINTISTDQITDSVKVCGDVSKVFYDYSIVLHYWKMIG